MNTNMKNMENNTIKSMKAQELTIEQMENTTGAKGQGQAIVDFFAWVTCGFNHHYQDTGKTKVFMDGPIPTRFKHVRCKDCGHKTWKRVGAVVPGQH